MVRQYAHALTTVTVGAVEVGVLPDGETPYVRETGNTNFTKVVQSWGLEVTCYMAWNLGHVKALYRCLGVLTSVVFVLIFSKLMDLALVEMCALCCLALRSVALYCVALFCIVFQFCFVLCRIV